MKKFAIILVVFTFRLVSLPAQEKRDYEWVIGGNSAGGGIRLNFSKPKLSVSYEQTGIKMEGSNTSMCDKNGNLIFCSNGCKIVNAKGEIMQNGDGINPGIIQNFYCPYGGSPTRQGVIAIPAPERDSLYYVFNLDWDQPYLLDTNYFGVAPQRMYYHAIDMSKDSGYGAVVQKNQIAIQDTFARGNIQAVKHTNEKDWWIIVPKSHTNCYFLIPVTSKGVQPAQLKCVGHTWSDEDSGSQTVFSPNMKKYIRFNAWNGLNIFTFDNATGDLSNPIQILFPQDTINYTAGVAVSPNSRYLYVCARKKIYQFDLEAHNIESSKILVAEWDGFYNPYATIFYLAALAPDGKIYISSTSSTLNLHVIHNPNCPGLSCNLEQHGISLPSYNFATIPNLPHYRFSNEKCDTTTTKVYTYSLNVGVSVYPNPTKDIVWVDIQNIEKEVFSITFFDLLGQNLITRTIGQSLKEVDLSDLKNGAYYYIIQNKATKILGKIIKVE